MPVILGRNAVFIYTAVQFRMGSIPAVVVSTHQVSSTFIVMVTVPLSLLTWGRFCAAGAMIVCRVAIYKYWGITICTENK